MSVTIKHIAERTGLSAPTVGGVLGRTPGRYSEKTRRLVMDAVRELGYRTNASARAMRNGRTGCVAFILSRSHLNRLSHIPAGLLDGLNDELALHSVHLSVSLLSDQQLSEDFVPQVLSEYVADGMLVNYTHEMPPRMLDLIHAHHSPVVWLNTRVEADCVYPDDFGGAVSATKALIAQGHRRIALVHLIRPSLFPGLTIGDFRGRQHYSVGERIAGYSAAMGDAGLAPRVAYMDRTVPDQDMVPSCVALLSGPDRPSAVLLYSENEIVSVMLAAERLRISIPGDLKLLHFGPADLHIGGMHVPCVPVPTEQVGRQAVRMLLKKIESPLEACPPEVVAYDRLRIEGITAPLS
jgi:LacI family transcriptional regulator